MAYVFLLNDDNSITASRREVLMQRSKLVDEIWFLVNPIYKSRENNMKLFSVMLEYILPVSKKYHTLELVKDKEGYKEYLKYVVPFDTNLSSEAGDVELQLSFVFVGFDAEGKSVQKVRKTQPAKLHITPISAWSDIIPDEALSALDQRIIMTQKQINELGYYAEIFNENQIDNLIYDEVEDTLQLSAKGIGVGDKISVKDMLDDGIPVVDLVSNAGSDSDDNSDTDNNDGCDCGCDNNKKHNNVVEF